MSTAEVTCEAAANRHAPTISEPFSENSSGCARLQGAGTQPQGCATKAADLQVNFNSRPISRAPRLWYENATILTGTEWQYRKIPQKEFEKLQPDDFADMNALDPIGLLYRELGPRFVTILLLRCYCPKTGIHSFLVTIAATQKPA